MIKTKKAENWLHKWGMQLAMLTMLGLIVWGLKEFVSDQRIFQKEQRKMNAETKEANATFREKCISTDFKISINSDVNQKQDVTLIEHGNKLVKHETEINFLKNQ